MRPGWLMLLVLASWACETGTEIAGVAQATATRASDGSIVVTATLDCMLAAGMSRADGRCDADHTRVCVEARWFTRSDPPPTAQSPGPAASAQNCREIASVRGETVQITMRPGSVPAGATIVVFSSDQHRARRAAHEVVIAGP